MGINFATGGTMSFPGRLYDSYWTPLYSQYWTNLDTTICTLSNRSMPSTSSDVYHVLIMHLANAGNNGGAVKIMYSNNNGSSYSNFSTGDMATVDSRTGGTTESNFDSVSMVVSHRNFDAQAHQIESQSCVWYYAPQSTQSRFRIRIGADTGSGGSPAISINRRSVDNQYRSISWFEEKIYHGVN